MRQTFYKEGFLKYITEYLRNSSGSLINTDADLLNDVQLEGLLSGFTGHLTFKFPQNYQFAKGTKKGMSETLIKKHGFIGLIPSIEVIDDCPTVNYYSLLYNEEGMVIRFDEDDHSYITFIAIDEAQGKAMDIFKDLVDNFKIKEDKEHITNTFSLYSDPVRQTLRPIKNEDICIQDERIIKYYDFNNEIQNMIRTERSGIFTFHGEPGCGKSSYIRYLAQTNTELDFCFCSLSTLLMDGGIRFFNRFLANTYCGKNAKSKRKPKDMIVIIEDSEKLLQDRTSNAGTASISTTELLNIIDGTGPGRGHVQFIFTYNQGLQPNQFDKAMFRKGRLLKTIEFKKFEGDTLKNIAKEFDVVLTSDELKNGATLSEIVYHSDDTGEQKQTKKKIGFCIED